MATTLEEMTRLELIFELRSTIFGVRSTTVHRIGNVVGRRRFMAKLEQEATPRRTV
jgi:hypothetical protein